MSKNATRDLRNVIVMALIDGDLSDQEKQFIESLRAKLDVDPDEFVRLCAEVREDRTKMSLPKDLREREATVALLASLASADGRVDDAERRVLEKIADRAGVSPGTLERMLASQGEQERPDQIQINRRVMEIYENFAAWDQATRQEKIEALRSIGADAVMALLKMLESYRCPDDMDGPLEMKAIVAEQLGELGDDRAVYYLAQQVNLADLDDEVSDEAFRHAAAEALGKIVGQSFTRDQAGTEAARVWWMSKQARRYDRLVF